MKKIAFLTTQEITGSTVVGRVLPLANKLAQQSEIHVLLHGKKSPTIKEITTHITGLDPFTRTPTGKVRLNGFALITRMLSNAFQAAMRLRSIAPDAVVIVKALPENVLAIRIAKLFFFLPRHCKIILDVDDFELTANALSSALQRIVVHWASRSGSKLADNITVATPFLQDHFSQLSGKKKILLLPTGIDSLAVSPSTSVTLLYAGSISRSTGHRVDMLPAIFARVRRQVPSATLIMAGNGSDIESMQREFEKQGLSKYVEWIGRFDSNKLAELLGRSNIIIDPIDSSVTNRAKSSSRVALAVANGFPVVTSNVGIRPTLIPPALHERFFANASDIDSYAQKIISLLQQPLTADQTESMKTFAVRYNWSTLAAMFSELLV